MIRYVEMHKAYTDMLKQNKIYQPSTFWLNASKAIMTEISEYGLENFRRIKTVLDFFVPTYGSPGIGFSEKQSNTLLASLRKELPGNIKAELTLKFFLTGRLFALADFRVLLASDDKKNQPYLHTFSESNIGNPIEQFNFEGRYFSRSSLNYMLGLAMLKRYLRGELITNVLEIGGGYGSLGEILCNGSLSNFRYIDIDIPPTCYVAQYYLSRLYGEDNIATYANTAAKETISIETLPKLAVLCSWQIEKLVGRIDLFVNFISFQEMEPDIVKNYIEHIIRLKPRWVLLRNMKEGKNISKNGEVGVISPILGDDYIAMFSDYELIERNIFPFGHKTVDDFNSEILILRLKI